MKSTNPQARNYKHEGGDVDDFDGIDITLVSPTHGIKRADGKFGRTEYAYQEKDSATNELWSYPFPEKYTPEDNENYTKKIKDKNDYNGTLEDRYQLFKDKDGLNEFSIGDTYTTENLEGIDLIPFWIGLVGAEQKTHFRALLNGISETVSPSWSSNNFFGNPFAYHTYTSIERSVTFGLQLYCSSELELQKMWERISSLTSYTYPIVTGEEGARIVNPPIIEFRLGDIYNGKKGFLDSLSYTVADNGTWETNTDAGLLPKVIDVSITIKFIEQWDDVDGGLYSYELDKKAQAFSTEPKAE